MTTETGSVLTGTPAPAPAAAAPASAPAAPAPAPAWYESIEDQGAVAWAKGRGYKLDDPTETAKIAMLGHYNAEKLIGLDRAGRTLVMPKDDATPDEIAAYRQKLGVPAASKDYKLPDGLKEDPVAKAFLDVAHKAGYTQKHLDPVFEFLGQQTQALEAQQEAAREQKAQADVEALRGEWGGEFELRSETARRAVRELGLSKEEASSMEATLGVRRSAELFFQIGKGLLEDRAEGIGGGNGAPKFGLSKTEAQGRIKALQSDIEFSKKLLARDAGAAAEWENLHKVAFG